MKLTVALWITSSTLLVGSAQLVTPVAEYLSTQYSGLRAEVAEWYPPGRVIDINRPRSPFDCDLPIGEKWYGSRSRCLADLCAGQNVYNEHVFDTENRRRRNPCYGQNPTEFTGE